MTNAQPPNNNVAEPTHIHVSFAIVTPDQLRKIIFTLDKTSGANNDDWSISFELDERANTSGQFQMVIQLQVAVDHDDADKANATAKHGLDSDQRAQALVAGDTAKDVKTGDATKDDLASDTKAIVTARNPDSPN
jgi:hypothetical protein